MEDPIDLFTMDEIANHTKVDIRPVLVGPADLEFSDDALPISERLIPIIRGPDSSSQMTVGHSSLTKPKLSVSKILLKSAKRCGNDSTDLLAPTKESTIYRPHILDLDDDPLSVDVNIDDDLRDLDAWDVDEAITSDLGNRIPEPTKQKAEIISAYAAHNLFNDDEDVKRNSKAKMLFRHRW